MAMDTGTKPTNTQLVTVIQFWLGVVLMIAAAGASYGAAQFRMDEIESDLTDRKDEIRELNQTMSAVGQDVREIRTDVSWLRSQRGGKTE